jgi:hypothetical protein
VLSHVGIGFAIGQPLVVPILVRSLAVSIATRDEDELPLSFDYDFLMTMDSNLSKQNEKCGMVDIYECAWWNVINPPSLDLAEILDKSTLEKCLDCHMKQIVGPVKTITEAISPLATPATSTTSTTSAAQSVPGQRLPSSEPATPAKGTCEKCEEYSHILSNTLLDVVNIFTFAHMMLTCTETQWDIDMRRASTFNTLHEAAVIKEMAGQLSATSAFPMGVESVQNIAAQELKRLKELPPTSHKWTWGETLTKNEVLGLGRSGTNPNLRFHSGYDQPLIDGQLPGRDSSLPTMPETMDIDNMPSDTAPLPPDCRVQAILDFERIRSTFYDPLGKKRESHIFPSDRPAKRSTDPSHFSPKRHNFHPRVSANLTEENILLHTINCEASSHSGTAPVQFYEDREVSAGDKGVVMSKAVRIEDTWSSDSNPSVKAKLGNSSATGLHELRTPAVARDDVWVPTEDVWPSESEDIGVETPERVVELEVLSALRVEDVWVADDSHDDEDVVRPGTGIEASPDVEVPTIGIEDEWTSASDDEHPTAGDTNYSSQPTVNSQFMVSPSRVTLQNIHASFPLSEDWPDPGENIVHPNTTLVNQASGSFRRYGPEDFTNLMDCMFEEKLSESESSEEEDN